jgi:hypothetical protein
MLSILKRWVNWPVEGIKNISDLGDYFKSNWWIWLILLIIVFLIIWIVKKLLGLLGIL